MSNSEELRLAKEVARKARELAKEKEAKLLSSIRAEFYVQLSEVLKSGAVKAATWHVGDGRPTIEFGNANDFYLNTSNGDVFFNNAGTWGVVLNVKGKDGIDGKDGDRGETGRVGLAGTNGKNGKDGRDGKDGVDGKDGKDGAKGKDGRDGKDGRNGSKWHTGRVSPPYDTGEVGDFYLQENGTFYEKTKPIEWTRRGSLRGPAGANGVGGGTGGGSGEVGDLYLNDLIDVDTTSTPSDGDILAWDEGNQVFAITTPNFTGPTNLDDLDDVQYGGAPTDGQILMFMGDSEQWENNDMSAVISNLTTDDLAEGATNLYFTDARVLDALTTEGYVRGPVDLGVTDNTIPRYDGGTGDLIKGSNVVIDDFDVITPEGFRVMTDDYGMAVTGKLFGYPITGMYDHIDDPQASILVTGAGIASLLGFPGAIFGFGDPAIGIDVAFSRLGVGDLGVFTTAGALGDLTTAHLLRYAGDPNSNLAGPIGAICQQTNSGNLWLKTDDDGGMTGWSLMTINDNRNSLITNTTSTPVTLEAGVDIFVVDTAEVTITIPSSSGMLIKPYTIKNISDGDIYFEMDGVDLLDGSLITTPQVITSGTALTFVPLDGGDWIII